MVFEFYPLSSPKVFFLGGGSSDKTTLPMLTVTVKYAAKLLTTLFQKYGTFFINNNRNKKSIETLLEEKVLSL